MSILLIIRERQILNVSEYLYHILRSCAYTFQVVGKRNVGDIRNTLSALKI